MPTTTHANVTFELTLEPAPSGTISIQGVKGHERVSQPFRYVIYLTSDRALDLATIIGAKVKLVATLTYGKLFINGLVGEIVGFDPPRADQASGFSYALEVVPRVAVLDLHKQNRILGPDSEVETKDIITKVLQGTTDSTRGPAVAVDSTLDIRGTKYKKRQFVVQYDESDLAFLSRQCEQSGVFYFFRHETQKDVIVFGDDPGVFPKVTASGVSGAPADEKFNYNNDEAVNQPAVRSFGFAAAAVTSKTSIKDFDAARPTQPPSESSTVASGFHGVHYHFGSVLGGPLAPDQQAKVNAEALACRRVLFRGKSNLPNLRAGTIFELKFHPHSQMNRKYLVIGVEHAIMAPAQTGFDSPIPPQPYVNEFTCIPDDLPFRPERLTPIPRVAGVHSATVDAGILDGRAKIDTDGRYKVKFLHTMANAAQNQGSHYVRKMSPYSGASDTGLELPLLPGTEVLVSYQNGDIDFPVILGAVPNGDTASVVKEANQQYNRLRTPSGILIEMFDGPAPPTTTP